MHLLFSQPNFGVVSDAVRIKFHFNVWNTRSTFVWPVPNLVAHKTCPFSKLFLRWFFWALVGRPWAIPRILHISIGAGVSLDEETLIDPAHWIELSILSATKAHSSSISAHAFSNLTRLLFFNFSINPSTIYSLFLLVLVNISFLELGR